MTVVITILAFAFLIVFHEFGHFLLARMTGMKVERFAMGFGPSLIKTKWGETEIAICALPLGGYVKIAGMDPTDEGAADDPDSYLSKSPLRRILVILAGPMFNYILAAVLFALILVLGPMVPDMSSATLGEVLSGKPAAAAGFLRGDQIVAVDKTPITDWKSFQTAVYALPGKAATMTVKRGGEELTLQVTPEATKLDGKEIGLIGVVPHGVRGEGLGFGAAVTRGLTLTVEWNLRIVSGLYQIITGKQDAQLQGPVGIIERTSKAAEEGFIPLLTLIAVISVHLGLFNLLPIPALDGGRLVFLGLEVIFRRPVNARVELAVHAGGFLLLIGMMIVVTIGDIGRLWGGGDDDKAAPAAAAQTTKTAQAPEGTTGAAPAEVNADSAKAAVEANPGAAEADAEALAPAAAVPAAAAP